MDQQEKAAQEQPIGGQIGPPEVAKNPPVEPVATEKRLEESEQKIEKRMAAFEESMLRLHSIRLHEMGQEHERRLVWERVATSH